MIYEIFILIILTIMGVGFGIELVQKIEAAKVLKFQSKKGNEKGNETKIELKKGTG